MLHLKGGTKDHFMGFLRQEFPGLVAGYDRLYRGSYAPKDYVATVRARVNELRQRHDVHARMHRAELADVEEDGPERVAPEATQGMLWNIHRAAGKTGENAP